MLFEPRYGASIENQAPGFEPRQGLGLTRKTNVVVGNGDPPFRYRDLQSMARKVDTEFRTERRDHVIASADGEGPLGILGYIEEDLPEIQQDAPSPGIEVDEYARAPSSA